MADDVNKASGSINSVESIGAGTPEAGRRGGASLKDTIRRAEQSINKPIAEIRKLQQRLVSLRQKRQDLQDELEYIIANEEGLSTAEQAQSIADVSGDLTSTVNQISAPLGQLRNIRQTVNQRTAAGVGRAVSRYVSPGEQETRIRGMSREVNTLEPAIKQANQRGYLGLEQVRKQRMSQAQGVALQIESAQEAGDTARVEQLSGQLSTIEQEAAVASRGQQYLRQQGLDPQNRFNRANTVAARAISRQDIMGMNEAAESGGGRSVGDIRKEISGVADALRELKDQFKDGSLSLEEFNNKANNVADQFEKLEQEEKAAINAGGGGRGSRIAGFLRGAGMAGRVATDLGQVLNVDNRIASVNNVAQVAQQQNQQYDAVVRAMQGDMMAANMVLGGGFETAAMAQEDVATAQRRVRQGQAAVETADAGAAAFEAKATLGILPGIKGIFAGGKRGSTTRAIISSVADPAARAAMIGSDIANQVSEGQAGNAMYNATVAAQQALITVPVRQQQAFTDYSQAIGMVNRATGSSGLAGEMTGQNFLKTIGGMRIGTDRAARLAGMGVQQQGSDVFQTGQIFQARQFETMGMGSMEETMGRFGVLAQSNSKDPQRDLQRIMEEAISRGFSNSKGVQLMVDSVQNLAQSSGMAQLGIDASGGLTKLMGTALGMDDPNRSSIAEFRRAQTGVGAVSGVLSDNRLSLSNIARDVGLRQNVFGGGMTGAMQAANAANLQLQDIAVLRAGGEDAVRLAQSKGITGIVGQNGEIDKKKLNSIVEEQRSFFLRGGAGGSGLVFSPEVRKRMQEIGEGGITQKEINSAMSAEEGSVDRKAIDAIFSVMANTTSGKGGMEAFNALFGDPSTLKVQKVNRTDSDEAGDQLITRDAVRKAREAEAGGEKLGGIVNLNKALQTIEDKFVKNIDDFSEAAVQAAEKMRNDVNTESFKELGSATDELTSKFNVLSSSLDEMIRKSGTHFDPSTVRSTKRSTGAGYGARTKQNGPTEH